MKTKSIYIFKTNMLLRHDDLAALRNKIKEQLADGVLLLTPHAEYIGREIEIDGTKVTVKFIDEQGNEV